MNIEEVVLVNKKGKPKGLFKKEEAHRYPTKLHKAISVLIFDKDKTLIQKRAKNKKTWPMYWANTCCSHPRNKESFQKAAERRLFEEMGIKTKLKRVFKIIYESKFDNNYGENEYDWVFLGEYKGKVDPDPNEISEHKWISLKDLKNDIDDNPNIYTPWFKMILERI